MKKVSYFVAPAIARDKRKHLLNPISVKDIIQLVCNHYKVNPFDLKSKSRERDLVFPRHLAMYLVNEYARLNTIKTGKLFNRDHTTILHAKKMIQNYLETNSLDKREEILQLINYCEYRA